MSNPNSIYYLALLRGINVGGNNIIKMVDMRACFESMGFNDVATYIQSGNVMFKSSNDDMLALTEKIEVTLSDKFDYRSKIVLVTHNHLESVVKNAPPNFGTKPDEYKYDVLFLKNPLTPETALESIQTREGVDKVWSGENVLYYSRLISRAGQSYLNKIIKLSIYQSMTIRNWNTTTKLLGLMGK